MNKCLSLALQFQLQVHNNSLDIFHRDNKRVAYIGSFLLKIWGREGVASFGFPFYSLYSHSKTVHSIVNFRRIW